MTISTNTNAGGVIFISIMIAVVVLFLKNYLRYMKDYLRIILLMSYIKNNHYDSRYVYQQIINIINTMVLPSNISRQKHINQYQQMLGKYSVNNDSDSGHYKGLLGELLVFYPFMNGFLSITGAQISNYGSSDCKWKPDMQIYIPQGMHAFEFKIGCISPKQILKYEKMIKESSKIIYIHIVLVGSKAITSYNKGVSIGAIPDGTRICYHRVPFWRLLFPINVNKYIRHSYRGIQVSNHYLLLLKDKSAKIFYQSDKFLTPEQITLKNSIKSDVNHKKIQLIVRHSFYKYLCKNIKDQWCIDSFLTPTTYYPERWEKGCLKNSVSIERLAVGMQAKVLNIDAKNSQLLQPACYY